MTCREKYFSICNLVSPKSTTLLRMKCQCLVSRHWLGSISVYDKQHANFMNLLEGFLLFSLEILHSYHLLQISLFILSHPSPVLYSHNMDPSFMVFLKQLLFFFIFIFLYFIYLFSFYRYSTNNIQIETYKHYKIYNNYLNYKKKIE